MKNTIIALAASAIALGSVNAQTNVQTLVGGTDFNFTSWDGSTSNTSALTSPGAFLNPASIADGVGLSSGGPGLIFNSSFPTTFLFDFNSPQNITSFSINTLVGAVVDSGVAGFTLNLTDGSSTLASISDTAGAVGSEQVFSIAASGVTNAELIITSNLGLGSLSSSLTEVSEIGFSSIPEPSSALLLGLGAFGLLGRRKR